MDKITYLQETKEKWDELATSTTLPAHEFEDYLKEATVTYNEAKAENPEIAQTFNDYLMEETDAVYAKTKEENQDDIGAIERLLEVEKEWYELVKTIIASATAWFTKLTVEKEGLKANAEIRVARYEELKGIRRKNCSRISREEVDEEALMTHVGILTWPQSPPFLQKLAMALKNNIVQYICMIDV